MVVWCQVPPLCEYPDPSTSVTPNQHRKGPPGPRSPHTGHSLLTVTLPIQVTAACAMYPPAPLDVAPQTADESPVGYSSHPGRAKRCDEAPNERIWLKSAY